MGEGARGGEVVKELGGERVISHLERTEEEESKRALPQKTTHRLSLSHLDGQHLGRDGGDVGVAEVREVRLLLLRRGCNPPRRRHSVSGRRSTITTRHVVVIFSLL